MFRLKSVKNVTWYIEAVCQGLTIGFSEVLIIIWYSRQDSSAIKLGVMLTLPAAIGAITQAFATKNCTHQKSPQRLASLSIAGQVLGLAAMAFALTLTHYSDVFLFLGQCLYWMGGMTASSPTQEILAKTIPAPEHNRFFSRRAMIMTVVTLACNIISASLLDRGLTAAVLVQFMMIAAAARLVSLMMINGQPAPLILKGAEISPSGVNQDEALVSIIRLSICMFLFRCAVNISSPFYSAFMLKNLSMSFRDYSLITAVPLVTKTLCLTNWARLLDDNKKFEGLLIAIIAIGCTPILWSFNQSYLSLGGLQVVSGISWAGFDLITVLLIQHMYPTSITHKLGLFLALGSLGSVAGGIIGGALLNSLGSYQTVFAISGCCRLATGFLLLWYLRRNHLFRFHELNLRQGLSTLIAVKPSLAAAAKLIHFQPRKPGGQDRAA